MILHNGDCLEYLKTLEDNSVDLIFTDPPYALGSEIVIKENGKPDYKKAVDFMNKWDMPTGDFWEQWYKEAFRVLKHGGHCLMFGMDRQLLLFKYYGAVAGFTEKQSLYWYFISNFPKATDLSKNLDKHFGAKREVVGYKKTPDGKSYLDRNKEGRGKDFGDLYGTFNLNDGKIEAPTTPLAKKYEGLKYSIAPTKQTNETIMVFQKPYKTGSCLHDVLAYENGDESITVGAIDIDGNRVGVEKVESGRGGRKSSSSLNASIGEKQERTGRFPAQTYIDSGASEVIDKQSGISKSKQAIAPIAGKHNTGRYGNFKGQENVVIGHTDSGGASRILHRCDFEKGEYDLYFYSPKVSKSERNEGLEGFELKEAPKSARSKPAEGRQSPVGQPRQNAHPTVKPKKLLSNILKLFKTPNKQVLLDPFMGSGSMGISAVETGFDYIGVELDPEYYKIAEARINYAIKNKVETLL